MRIYILKHILLFFFILSCIKPELKKDFIYTPVGVFENENEKILLYEINNIRENLTPLLLDVNFNIAALRRIEDIKLELSEELPISHTGYIKAYIYLDSLGISSIAENLAYKYTSVENVIKAWMVSENHSKVLINEKWKYIGITIGRDEEDNNIYCVIFGW